MKYIFTKATNFIKDCFFNILLYCLIVIIITYLNKAYQIYKLGNKFKNCQEYKSYLQEQIDYKRELKSKCLNKCSEDCENQANKPMDKKDKNKLLECNLKKLSQTKI